MVYQPRYTRPSISRDKGLISRFEWLRAQPKDEPATLPVYIAFDILELAGHDVRDRPLKQRRRALERLVWHHSMIFPARRLADDGEQERGFYKVS